MSHGWALELGGRGLPLGYAAGTAALLWVMSKARRSLWLCALLALPGTVCHEACHWLAGRVLNGHPKGFTVLPRREGKGFVLGAVALGNLRWYNAFFIGLAPLALLPLAYLLFLWTLGDNPAFGWPQGLVMYFLASLIFGALPSGPDLRIAARSPIGWLLLGGLLAWGWRHYSKPETGGKAGFSLRAPVTTGRQAALHAC